MRNSRARVSSANTTRHTGSGPDSPGPPRQIRSLGGTRPTLNDMVRRVSILVIVAALAFVVSRQSPAATSSSTDVTHATLPNGLQVAIVHDALAPVVTV